MNYSLNSLLDLKNDMRDHIEIEQEYEESIDYDDILCLKCDNIFELNVQCINDNDGKYIQHIVGCSQNIFQILPDNTFATNDNIPIILNCTKFNDRTKF